MINLYNADCLQAMRKMDTDQYDLAIVDPPYGIKGHKPILFGREQKSLHKGKNWDNKIPNTEYFTELLRVSKNQIIWGGNYFVEYLYNSRCWLVWDKHNGTNNISDCELAWTSFFSSVRKFTYSHVKDVSRGIKRIHPTQKPDWLYSWILQNYAKEGDKILDTHLGSGSIAVACHDMGFSLDGYELDTDYYEAACKRLREHQRQLQLPI